MPPPKTAARSGVARSAATRSGYPVLAGAHVKLFALSTVARAGATRSNYHSGRPFILIAGHQVGWAHEAGMGVLARSLTIADALNHTPTTANLTIRGFVPAEGSDLVITLGSRNNAHREFGGTLTSVNHRYLGKPAAPNMVYDGHAIDYTWGLDRRKVSGKYTNTTVAAVAASLLTVAPGYTLNVAADIGATLLDEITFTEQDLPDALTQLTKRVGGDWDCDYSKVVGLFFDDTRTSPPAILNALHPSLRDLAFTRDLSQVVTRCLGEFGGSDALEQIAPGATILPVLTAAWYLTTGGVVLVGQQRVTYGGIVVGGGGSLVGPGAAPTASMNTAVIPGAGVTFGAHDYAVTFVTAAGESIPSPRSTVSVGTMAPPTVAPTLGSPLLPGPGPDPGTHDYAVTFVSSGGGETTPGPRLTVSTDLTPPPTTGPNPTLGAEGPGPDFGTHDYAVSFVTASGETTPSPTGGTITTGNAPINPPATAPTLNATTAGGLVEYGLHYWGVTFLTAYGETTIGPLVGGTVGYAALPNPGVGPALAIDNSGSSAWLNAGARVYYEYTWVTASGETLPSPNQTLVTIGTSGASYTSVTAYGSTDARCTSVNIYRNSDQNGTAQIAGQWMLAGSVANNPTGGPCATFQDQYTVAGHAPPSVNTTDPNRTVPLVSIPRGSADVVARRVYRSLVGTSTMRLLVHIADNTSTTYTDNKADAALGAAPPAGNTALGTVAVNLDTIPKGTGTSSTTVTARKLYRRSGGAGLRYLDTIANNSTTTYTDTKANAALGAAPPTVNGATLRQIPLTAIPIGGPFISNRNVYRSKVGSSTLYYFATLDNVVTTLTDTTPDASLGAAAPTVNTAAAAQVAITAIPVGPASVTGRKVYRTAAGASQLKLLVTLADNTTTVYTDALADGSLGANAPTSDTSTLQQPQGNVLAGSPTMPVASVAAFRTTGGWAIAGSQAIRYTGIAGNTLTGIPAAGTPGALNATITFNATITAAAMLTGIPASGVGAIKYPILRGDPVNIFIQADDTAAQAALAAQLGGGDGVVESELRDRRLSYTEGLARCRAQLTLLAARDADGKVGIVTVSYACRDINTRAGVPVTIYLGPPINLRGDFLIQRVNVSRFDIPHINPTYSVEASSVRFTFDELLRVIRESGA